MTYHEDRATCQTQAQSNTELLFSETRTADTVMKAQKSEELDPTVAVARTLAFMEREWFGGSVQSVALDPTIRLLLVIYLKYQAGHLLSRSDAAKIMRIDHKATAQRYIERIVSLGIVLSEQAHTDKRMQLLVPTEKGLRLLEDEARRLASELKLLGAEIKDGKKETGFLDAILPETEIQTPPSRRQGHFFEFELDERLQSELKSLNATLQLVPRHRQALMRRARVNAELGHEGAALADYELADRIIRATGKERLLRVQILHKFRRFDDALMELDDIAATFGETIESMGTRAFLHASNGDSEKALSEYTRLIERIPDSWEGYFLRSKLNYQMRRRTAALEDLKKALERRDTDKEPLEETIAEIEEEIAGKGDG